MGSFYSTINQNTKSSPNDDNVYVLTQQTSKSTNFDENKSTLNFIGLYATHAMANTAAQLISENIPDHNIFIYQMECGVYTNFDFQCLENEYPLDKWRNGQIVNEINDPDVILDVKDSGTNINKISSEPINCFISNFQKIKQVNYADVAKNSYLAHLDTWT